MGGSSGGGGGRTNTTTTNQVNVPPAVQELQSSVLPQVTQAANNLPLTSFQGAMPTAVQPMSGAQSAAVDTLTGQLNAPINPATAAATYGLLNTALSPAGTDPASQAGIAAIENQYQTRTLPSVQNQMALAGLGRSDALGASINDARAQTTAAEVPLIQQSVQNQIGALQPLAAQGQYLQGLPVQQAQTAFQAQEAQRQLQQAQLQEQQQNFLRNQAITEAITSSVTGMAPATFGSTGTNLSTSSQGIPVSFGTNLGKG